jgi:hypothetical protein
MEAFPRDHMVPHATIFIVTADRISTLTDRHHSVFLPAQDTDSVTERGDQTHHAHTMILHPCNYICNHDDDKSTNRIRHKQSINRRSGRSKWTQRTERLLAWSNMIFTSKHFDCVLYTCFMKSWNSISSSCISSMLKHFMGQWMSVWIFYMSVALEWNWKQSIKHAPAHTETTQPPSTVYTKVCTPKVSHTHLPLFLCYSAKKFRPSCYLHPVPFCFM